MIIKFIGMYTNLPVPIVIDSDTMQTNLNILITNNVFLESKIVPALAVVFLLIYFSVALYYYNL